MAMKRTTTERRTPIAIILPVLLVMALGMAMLAGAQTQPPSSGSGSGGSTGVAGTPWMQIDFADGQDASGAYYVIGVAIAYSVEIVNGGDTAISWTNTYVVQLSNQDGSSSVVTKEGDGTQAKLAPGGTTVFKGFKDLLPKPADPTTGAAYSLVVSLTLDGGSELSADAQFKVSNEQIKPEPVELYISLHNDVVAPGDKLVFDLIAYSYSTDLTWVACCPGSWGWDITDEYGTVVALFPPPEYVGPAMWDERKLAAGSRDVIASDQAWDQTLKDGSMAPSGTYIIHAKVDFNDSKQTVPAEAWAKVWLGKTVLPTPEAYLSLVADKDQYKLGETVVLTTVLVNPTESNVTYEIGGCTYSLTVTDWFGVQVYPGQPVACPAVIAKMEFPPGKTVLGADKFVPETEGIFYATSSVNTGYAVGGPEEMTSCMGGMGMDYRGCYYNGLTSSIQFQVGDKTAPPQVEIQLKTDKDQYKLGETAILVTSVVNPTDEPISMTFLCCQEYSLSIFDASGNLIFLSNHLCGPNGDCAASKTTSFPPGGTVIGKDAFLASAEGTYYATAALNVFLPYGYGGYGYAEDDPCNAPGVECFAPPEMPRPVQDYSASAIVQVGDLVTPPGKDGLIVTTDAASYLPGTDVIVTVALPVYGVPIGHPTDPRMMGPGGGLPEPLPDIPYPWILYAEITDSKGNVVWTWSPLAYRDQPYEKTTPQVLPPDEEGGQEKMGGSVGGGYADPAPPPEETTLATFTWDQKDSKGVQVLDGKFKVTVYFADGADTLTGAAVFGIHQKTAPPPPITQEPLATPAGRVAVGGAAIGVVAVGAIVLGTELGKLAFLTLMLPLYTRLRREEVLDQFLRGKIQGYVIANPGEHYNAIRDALDISNGTLAYHLRVLEREGYLRTMRDGMYKRYYPGDEKLPSRKYLNLAQNLILDQIKTAPGISQTEISDRMHTSVQVVNYYVQRLWRLDLITLQKDGRRTRCFLREDKVTREADGRYFVERVPGEEQVDGTF